MTRSQKWTLAAAVLASATVFLDSTVVNVALPRIGHDLPHSLVGVLEGQTYVYTGYLLTLSTLLILAGALTDTYGRRRMFIFGLVGFGLTSALCGLAPNLETLVVLRVLQGVAGAFLVPGSLALITANFSGPMQGRAFGIWSGASSGTTLIGPAVGGLLVDTISWRVAFLMNIPITAVALYAAWKHVPESKSDAPPAGFDWLGAIITGVAVGGLAFGTVYGQQREWKDPVAYAMLAVGAIATAGLPFYMARARNPLIPLRLFKSRAFTTINISTLLIYGALYALGYNSALFVQGTLGYTAAAAGLSSIPSGILLTLLSPRFGTLAGRYGPRPFLIVGPLVMAAATLLYARVPATSTAWQLRADSPSSLLPPTAYFIDLLPPAIVFGVGISILVAPLTSALMASVPVANAGLASSINNAISRIGPQLAGALIFVAVTAVFYTSLASRVPGLDPSSASLRAAVAPLNRPTASAPAPVAVQARYASGDAFHAAMFIAAGLLLAGAAANAIGLPRKQPETTEKKEEEAAA
ncbi:MAG TPA: MFS transporter [Candidatus Dormibacteraeota bacterium]|jgi:EmrB/QacA subfamily drug resistance transporter|nr:MFS transporter [Candidatus Dormibacteraeota bacterium]